MLDHESNRIVKMLVAAHSGAGKTGALSSLLDAGLNVRVLDFDNGLSVVKNHVQKRESLGHMHYATLRDELKLAGGRFAITKANAFQRAMELLDKGGGEWGDDSIGPLKTWTPQDVLVVDTFGNMGRSCLLMVMQINGAIAKNPEIQHYGQAMENLERFLAQVTSPAVKCHVIVNTHLYRSDDSPMLYPEALGSRLGPKVARYFDNFFSISATGTKRTIKTEADGLLMLKCAKKLSAQYQISDGYAQIFRELTGVQDLTKLGEELTTEETDDDN